MVWLGLQGRPLESLRFRPLVEPGKNFSQPVIDALELEIEMGLVHCCSATAAVGYELTHSLPGRSKRTVAKEKWVKMGFESVANACLIEMD